MRNLWRVLAFDVAAPLAAIAALVAIGQVLSWPWWWISACSVLVLLIVEGVVVNVVLWRRDSVTVGTDDDGPALRLGVAALCAGALVAAVLVGYNHWSVPDRDRGSDADEVVRVATTVAEATASFSPQHPSASIDRAAGLMVPEQAAKLRDGISQATADLAQHNMTATAETLSAGVEALGPSVAQVAVILRVTRSAPGQQAEHAVVALQVPMTKLDGDWLVIGLSPLHTR